MILTPKLLLALAILAAADYTTIASGVVIDPGNDIHAVLTELDEYYVISIRGTVIKDIDNWLTDFDAFPMYHEAVGWTPRGFFNAANALLARVEILNIKDKQLILTGHSLGGSVAVLLAALLVYAGWKVIAYAAFEPARSGFRTEAHILKDVEGYISRYGNDPVPEVPPLYQHPCMVTTIGQPAQDPFSCHAISGIVTWMQTVAESSTTLITQ